MLDGVEDGSEDGVSLGTLVGRREISKVGEVGRFGAGDLVFLRHQFGLVLGLELGELVGLRENSKNGAVGVGAWVGLLLGEEDGD